MALLIHSTPPSLRAQLEHKWHFRLQGDLLGPFWDLNQSLQNAVSNNRCALQILKVSEEGVKLREFRRVSFKIHCRAVYKYMYQVCTFKMYIQHTVEQLKPCRLAALSVLCWAEISGFSCMGTKKQLDMKKPSLISKTLGSKSMKNHLL